tara:strand:- start:199 stop:657 length:459 start_codon:yes stop_codon:yes gene_type:complete
MKLVLILSLIFFSSNTFSYDFELEILSTRDARDLHVFKYSDAITYRQFKGTTSWKDNLGDWGKLECAGNHTITKGEGTKLINYCKGTNKDGDTFRFIMNRVSDDFDTGIGKIKYDLGSGKFAKYKGTECVYAITFLPNGDASFIKTKCNFKK